MCLGIEGLPCGRHRRTVRRRPTIGSVSISHRLWRASHFVVDKQRARDAGPARPRRGVCVIVRVCARARVRSARSCEGARVRALPIVRAYASVGVRVHGEPA